jgi:hypothetical protein
MGWGLGRLRLMECGGNEYAKKIGIVQKKRVLTPDSWRPTIYFELEKKEAIATSTSLFRRPYSLSPAYSSCVCHQE